MIANNIDGHDYRINFSYNEGDHNIRITNCKIEKVVAGGRFDEGGSVIGTGKAICDSRDRFEKRIGRKMALSRAIKDLPKSERTSIWSAYFSKTNEKVAV